jgi:hypothetical protein
MMPTISLGPLDECEIEIEQKDIYPIICLIVEIFDPLNADDSISVESFLYHDGLCLRSHNESFFSKLETICKRIVGGEIAHYDVEKIRASEFAPAYGTRYAQDGIVTPGVKDAAQRYLDFLASNPDYWPWRNDGV